MAFLASLCFAYNRLHNFQATNNDKEEVTIYEDPDYSGTGFCQKTYDERGYPIEHPMWQKEINHYYEHRNSNMRFPPPSLIKRAVITSSGARVTCWPGIGGVYIKHASLAELEFLDISSTEDTVRPWYSTDEEAIKKEEEFCYLLRMAGADFYRPDYWNDIPPSTCRCIPLERCRIMPTHKNWLGFAWRRNKTSGTWGSATVFDLRDAKNSEKVGPGLHGYYNAVTMEKRSQIVENFENSWKCGTRQHLWSLPGPNRVCKELWCDQYHRHCSEWTESGFGTLGRIG